MAPSPPSLDFFEPADVAPVVVVLPLEEFRREAPSLDAGLEAAEDVERRDEELTVRGAEVAEAERPISGGPEGVEAAGVDGFDAGLSQEEKKSSSSAVAVGVDTTSAAPSTNIRAGYLSVHNISNRSFSDF